MKFTLKLTMLALVVAIGAQLNAATVSEAREQLTIATSLQQVKDIVESVSFNDRDNGYLVNSVNEATTRIKEENTQLLKDTYKAINELDKKIALAEKDKQEEQVKTLKAEKAALIKSAEEKAGLNKKSQSRFGWKTAVVSGLGVAGLGYAGYKNPEAVKQAASKGLEGLKTALGYVKPGALKTVEGLKTAFGYVNNTVGYAAAAGTLGILGLYAKYLVEPKTQNVKESKQAVIKSEVKTTETSKGFLGRTKDAIVAHPYYTVGGVVATAVGAAGAYKYNLVSKDTLDLAKEKALSFCNWVTSYFKKAGTKVAEVTKETKTNWVDLVNNC